MVLIEFPRPGNCSLGFVTGTTRRITEAFGHQELINCFVPTTPNPTSGFFLLIPNDELIEVDLAVEDAFKLIMSAGLVGPSDQGSLDRSGQPQI